MSISTVTPGLVLPAGGGGRPEHWPAWRTGIDNSPAWLAAAVDALDDGEELSAVVARAAASTGMEAASARRILEAITSQEAQRKELLGELATDQLRAADGARAWVREFGATKDPEAPTWTAVNRVLGSGGSEGDRDWLARELLAELKSKDGSWLPSWLPEMPETGSPGPWNSALANRLRAIGEDDLAQAWLAKASEIAAEHPNEPGRQWSRWVDWWGDGGWPFLNWLAKALWNARRRRSSLRRPQVVVVAGQEHAKAPKALAGFGWAIQGPAEKVDGDRYTNAPGANAPALYLPRTHELLPRFADQKPGQRVLPFEAFEPAEPATLALAGLTAERDLMTPTGGKLAVLLACGFAGRATLRTWTKLLQPGRPRYQPRDDDATAEAFNCLQDLRVYLPEGTCFRVFDMEWPYDRGTSDPSQMVGGMRGQLFEQFAGNQRGWQRSERGEFVINLDGYLRLDNRQAQLQRYYLRAAAAWNVASDPTGKFERGRLEPVNVERLAVLCNALSPTAVGLLRGQAGNRRKLYEAKRKASESLEQLRADGLVQLERPGRTRKSELLILPPEAVLEAWEQFRSAKGRRSRKGPAQ